MQLQTTKPALAAVWAALCLRGLTSSKGERKISGRSAKGSRSHSRLGIRRQTKPSQVRPETEEQRERTGKGGDDALKERENATPARDLRLSR